MNNIKAQVHLVPTEESSLSLIASDHALKLEKAFREGDAFRKMQHLYFTTDEEIKEGDWFIAANVVEKATKELIKLGLSELCRKIVATTNPELWGRLCGASDGQFTESNGNRVSKFVGNPELIENSGCAKINTSFIEAYIKAYNAGNPIKEVLLEQVDNGYEVDMEGRGGSDVGWMPKLELKLKQDGSVIVHLPEEKLYTREELKKITKESWYLSNELVDFDKWFNNNY
jgi:hypothetical protein